ncbi:MAG TPA: multidrug efflux RND transporter permease subunit [Terriglobia bacterium]|nr:multidrug efflux RND transporter permease subunit [Terriglobia bacterium]
MVNFFIDRPIFAAVISIVIFVAGLLAMLALPIAEYPKIALPVVQVTANYPGANAQVVEQTVATPIEEQVNGAEGMVYMQSTSSNTGQMVLNVTFDLNRDPDLAAVDVQNRISLAEPSLPQDVTREGISVRKQSVDFVDLVTLTSPNNAYDQIFLSNYATINIVDALARLKGVGSVIVFGARNYGMRVWLNPDKMAQLGITATDVADAIRQQNVQAPAGQVGAPPASEGQEFQYTVQVKGRLTSPAEFGNIVVRANPDGSIVHIHDIGRAQLAAEDYSSFSRLSGTPTVVLAVMQLPGANALDVANEVSAQMKTLAKRFPSGVQYEIPLDTTDFVKASIREVVFTLGLTFGLVFLVVYIFLQSFRATLIPALTVPVSLVGAFAIFTLLGFSINTLTLFGLVLAIGLVVDDAIVVVEACQVHIDEDGMTPRDAAKKAMSEVSGPVVAVALVLTAVFVPVAFVGGITGQLYKQFALTLAASVLLSALQALTLSPALCALLLKPGRIPRGPLGWFFRGFNWTFRRVTRDYVGSVKFLARRKAIVVVSLLLIFGAIYALFRTLPSGFVPPEDQGYFFTNVQLPDGAALDRTSAVVKQVEDILKRTPGVEAVVAVGGFSFVSSTYNSNDATLFVMMKPWSERNSPNLSINAIIARTQAEFFGIPQAMILNFAPPAIQGLGTTGGFQFELQDRSGGSIENLAAVANRLIGATHQEPAISQVFTGFRPDVPQINLDVDRDKVKTLGVPLTDVFNTLQTDLGGLYINDFNLFGRTYHVILQAATPYRSNPEDIGNYYVRSGMGQMIPLSTLASLKPINGPDTITRYNLYRSVEIDGASAPGYSSGQAIAAMEDAAKKVLPSGFGYEWTGMSYQEVKTHGQVVPILLLAVLFVFLFLAALYESWMVPIAVLLAVPLGILGALAGTWLRGLDNNVYAQIGLVVLVGLAAKNAILIVEFAKTRHEHGLSLFDAAVEGSRVRFRPILMTSFAFIFGVLPLAIAVGAGSNSRHSLGTSVVGGMIAATVLAVLFVPVFYVIVQGLAEWRKHKLVPEPSFELNGQYTTAGLSEDRHSSSRGDRE